MPCGLKGRAGTPLNPPMNLRRTMCLGVWLLAAAACQGTDETNLKGVTDAPPPNRPVASVDQCIEGGANSRYSLCGRVSSTAALPPGEGTAIVGSAGVKTAPVSSETHTLEGEFRAN